MHTGHGAHGALSPFGGVPHQSSDQTVNGGVAVPKIPESFFINFIIVTYVWIRLNSFNTVRSKFCSFLFHTVPGVVPNYQHLMIDE